MKSGFDISRIGGSGYVILPLSMSRLSSGLGQDPNQCYEMLQYFGQRLEQYESDAVILYSVGLYQNAQTTAGALRIKLHNQALQHAQELRRLIASRHEFIPKAIHFLPFDYVILNSNYSELFGILKKRLDIDPAFKQTITLDIGDSNYAPDQENFILEELVVTHVLREKMILLPKVLVTDDQWRLLVYPGNFLESDKYQWQNSILPKKGGNKFGSGFFNYTEKNFISFL